MKALILKEVHRLSYEDFPEPEVGPGDVLVAVKACGICGSDVHGMDGSTGRRRPPIVMGHEAAGVIARTGTDVALWKVGDRVTFDSTVYCDDCEYCRAGHINLCVNRRVLGVSCEDYRRHGAFADFVSVPQRILYRLPDALSFEHAAMVEPLSVAVHAVRRAGVAAGETAVVVGAGMIGLLLVQVLAAYGCSRVIAVDVYEEKLALAAKLGATQTKHSKDIRSSFHADHAFDCVGTDHSVDLTLSCVRKGGCVTLVGNIAPRINWPLQFVVTHELTVRGSCASAGEYPECIDLLACEAVKVAPLISAVAPLADGATWFERLHHREAGLMKVILKP